jgi:1,4-alpha-glucan branching enzyme
MLPLSHDEVVHGKGSLLARMPGDDWQKRANLRLLLGYMFAQPGKKLLFMGGELGQPGEWSHQGELDWHLLQDPAHAGILQWVRDLNGLYREEPVLRQDFSHEGFEWVEANDGPNSVMAFLRKAPDVDPLLAVFNFTPVPRNNYRVGVHRQGRWEEILNSDSQVYGGSGLGNLGGVTSRPVPYHGRFHSLNLTLPPLSAVFFRAPAAEGA